MKKFVVGVSLACCLLAGPSVLPAFAVDEAVQAQLLKQLFRAPQENWLQILTENNRVIDNTFFERCDARIRWDMENNQIEDALRFSLVADLASRAVGQKGKYRWNLAQIFRKNNNEQMFKDLIDNILLSDPTDQDALFERASIYAGNADLPVAYDMFKQLNEQGYRRDETMYRMGKLSLLMDQDERGEKEIDQALALNPNHKEARELKNKILAARPKIVPPGDAFSRVPVANSQGGNPNVPPVAANPSQVSALFNDAERFMRAQDISAAEGAYVRVLQADPSHVKARVYLGALYYRQNNLDQAIAQLTQAAQLDPRDQEAWHFLGNCYERRFDARGNKADLDLAADAYGRGLQIAPGDRMLQIEVSRIHGKKASSAQR